jgi:hypothetical protein
MHLRTRRISLWDVFSSRTNTMKVQLCRDELSPYSPDGVHLPVEHSVRTAQDARDMRKLFAGR